MPHDHRFGDDLADVAPLTLEVFRSYRRSMQLHRQAVVARGFGENELSLPQLGCLQLVLHEDGISQRDIAESLQVSRPTVTTMLHALESAGVITRRPDEHDRRLTRVYVTEKGNALHDKAHAVFADYINNTIGEMTEADQRELARLLNDLSERTARLIETTKEGTAE